jgi:hypothetical protein
MALGGMLLIGLLTVAAHEITLEWAVSEGTLELRGWVGGEQAAGAAVEIQSAGGRVLMSGAMDDEGRYRWRVEEGGPITVIMRDGLGHRRTVRLSAAELRGEQLAERGGGAEPVRVVVGLTFLLALAGAWMGYRNTRRLAALERRLGADESGS